MILSDGRTATDGGAGNPGEMGHDDPVPSLIRPTLDDPAVAHQSAGVGGRVGRRAVRAASWWAPFQVCILLSFLVFGAGVVMRSPCADSGFQDGRTYIKMCYTDVGKLYVDRGLDGGTFPYASRLDGTEVVEYPVLQGILMWLPTKLIDNTKGDLKSRTITYYGITAVLLYALLLVAIWATMRTAGRRPWDAAILAAAPSVALVGVLNWDFLPVALLALAILAWSRERPWLAGILLGLGGAAKLYPLLMLFPLLLLAVRTGRYRGFVRATLGAVGIWCLVNLPIAFLYPDGWRRFYDLSRGRGIDFGSLWLGLRFVGVSVDSSGPNFLAFAGFLLLLFGIAGLVLLAPRRPRFVQLCLLTLIAFLLTNKVYSPQFVLWMLPLVALARPRWRDVMIWQAGQAVYYGGVWLWLNQFADASRALSDRGYGFLILIQVASQLYIAVLVVRDIWWPAHDPVRAAVDGVPSGVDDPSGGEFDRAPDARGLPLGPSTTAALGFAASPQRATVQVPDDGQVPDEEAPLVVDDSADADGGSESSERVAPTINSTFTAASSPLSSVLVADGDVARPAGWPSILGRLTFGDVSALRWWALTRLAMLVGVGAAAWLLAKGSEPATGFFSRWVRWDAVHLETIASFGYDGDPSRPAVPFEAFFPGFPLTLKPLLALGIPAGAAGLLISATALAVAVVALRRLGDLEAGAGVGERAVVLLLLSPWAVFLMAGYSEALFLAFAIPAWLAAKRNHWWLAGILAMGASSTRVTGLFLAAALVVQFVLYAREKASSWPAVLLPFFPPLVYTVFQWQRTGDPKRWLTAQDEGWDRHFTSPIDAWTTTWNGAFGGGQSTNFVWMWRAELVAALLAVAFTVWLLRTRRWPEAVYVGGQTLALITSSYYLSIPRAFLLWWPVWIGLAVVVKRRPAWWPWILAVFIPLNIGLAIAFTQSKWAG